MPAPSSREMRSASFSTKFLFHLQDLQRSFQHGIGIKRDAVDPRLDEKLREIRMIRRPLAANADLAMIFVCRADEFADTPLDRLVAFIVDMCDQVRISIYAQR